MLSLAYETRCSTTNLGTPLRIHTSLSVGVNAKVHRVHDSFGMGALARGTRGDPIVHQGLSVSLQSLDNRSLLSSVH